MHLILIFSESDNSLEIPVMIGIREVKIGDVSVEKLIKVLPKVILESSSSPVTS